jgi:hypothetical protein
MRICVSYTHTYKIGRKTSKSIQIVNVNLSTAFTSESHHYQQIVHIGSEFLDIFKQSCEHWVRGLHIWKCERHFKKCEQMWMWNPFTFENVKDPPTPLLDVKAVHNYSHSQSECFLMSPTDEQVWKKCERFVDVTQCLARLLFSCTIFFCVDAVWVYCWNCVFDWKLKNLLPNNSEQVHV